MPLKGTNNLDNYKGCKIITQDPSLFTYLSLPLYTLFSGQGRKQCHSSLTGRKKRNFHSCLKKKRKFQKNGMLNYFAYIVTSRNSYSIVGYCLLFFNFHLSRISVLYQSKNYCNYFYKCLGDQLNKLK